MKLGIGSVTAGGLLLQMVFKDQIKKETEKTDQRITAVAEKTDQKIEKLDQKITAIAEKTDQKIEKLDQKITDESRQTRALIEKALDRLEMTKNALVGIVQV